MTTDRQNWRQHIANVILISVASVQSGHPHDASAWIDLEDRVGPKMAEEIWNDKTFAPVLHALDYYCHAAQHDEWDVGEGLTIDHIARILIECAESLERGEEIFPRMTKIFAWK